MHSNSTQMEISSSNSISVGAARRPALKETSLFCGDIFHVEALKTSATMILIDGLGHGQQAAEIAESGLQYITKRLNYYSIDSIIYQAGRDFQGSRGFVLAICKIDLRAMELSYCGVGNITVKLMSEKRLHSILGARGIIGNVHQKPTLRKYSIKSDSSLLMHSDGISSNLHMLQIMGVIKGSAQNTAENILTQFARSYDDASVIFAKW